MMTLRMLLLLFPALLGLLAACTPDAGAPTGSAEDGARALDAGSSSGASTSGAGSSRGVEIEVEPSAEQKAFSAKLQGILEEASSLGKEAFLSKYAAPDAPVPLDKIGYEPLKADYMSLINVKLKLTAAEKKAIAKNGFVVSGRLSRPTMAEALLQVYKQDLPVLVTTDMILQALHRSYDDILKDLESEVLAGAIDEALARTHAKIPKKAGDSDLDKVHGYADFFVAVARSLLAGKPVPTRAGPVLDDAVVTMLADIDGSQMKSVDLFGGERMMDFSQFKPRGHYAGDPKLERYFRAMMWLGRADLRPLEYDAVAGQWKYHPEQLAVAVLLRNATDKGGAMARWQQANDLITLMVGPIDYIDFSGLEVLMKEHGLSDEAGVLGLASAAADKLKAQLLAGGYGGQKIASHWLETDPFSAEVTPLSPSFAYLGQRFVVDSHVFANVVYDRVLFQGKKVFRRLPSPLDAIFVLGNNHALTLLAGELAKFPYQGALHTLRFLIDSYPEPFWESSLYNLWLSALRTLNKPTTAAAFPTAMKTPAWADKTVHTQLASWAQLRHDTLLYTKQSYTGTAGCEHPDGFVEPAPEFYGKLAHMADLARQALLNAPFANAYLKSSLDKFFETWRAHMETLAAISKKELAHKQLSEEDVAFLKKTIMADPGCGDPIFSGWYTSLYYHPENIDDFKPTIADVHTNPNTDGPLAPPAVLHVATGDVNLMIFTSDTCGTPEAFVGPVFRYHELVVDGVKRLSDDDWEKMLQAGEAPGQPAWTASFRVAK